MGGQIRNGTHTRKQALVLTWQEAYLDFFRHIDESMGIYMHRWGDAPIHLLAVALLLVSGSHQHKNWRCYLRNNACWHLRPKMW